MQAFQFYSPVKILFGKDTYLQVGQICEKFGKRALIVTTKGTNRRSPLIKNIQNKLKALDIHEFRTSTSFKVD
jgi:alcohol dehydrogenase YqhD (iron-dependent ADH family)